MLLRSVLTPEGNLTAVSVDQARARGATDAAIASSIITQVLPEVAAQATALRTQVVTTDPAKLQEYAIKEKIAANPELASEGEIALLTAEAAARGLTVEALMAAITSRAAQLRQVALGIAVWEATAKAALSNLDLQSIDPLADLESTLTANRTAAQALMSQAMAPVTPEPQP